MINLLSPAIKEQISFAKYNAIAIRYVKLLVFLAVVISGAFAGAWVYLDQKSQAAQVSFQETQDKIAKYKTLENDAKLLNDRIAAIKAIQDSQPHFSILLGDLAAAMPKKAALNAITLTGDDKKPIRITAIADTYATAVTLKEALKLSPRIAEADIETVSNTKDGVSVTMTISFKPGQAK